MFPSILPNCYLPTGALSLSWLQASPPTSRSSFSLASEGEERKEEDKELALASSVWTECSCFFQRGAQHGCSQKEMTYEKSAVKPPRANIKLCDFWLFVCVGETNATLFNTTLKTEAATVWD
ncbi:hypothetical protein AMECASPLE_003635 [Ameca splendens]|uniref:Uncharacterized protein n=1 Tax=Ameca splendens TaxID=208324 RepID=A0ABV0Y9U1_9TELE